MRTEKQQKKFINLINLFNGEEDLEGLMSKTYIKYLQNKLVEQFEDVIGVNLFKNQINSTDNELYEGYLRQYYNFKLYILYFEYLEKYDVCSTITQILELARYQHIKLLTDDISELVESWEAIIDIAEDELNILIEETYGTNF